MEGKENNEVVMNKMESEESIEELAAKTGWTKKESVQVLWYFVIAFIVLMVFGYFINRILL